MSSRNYPPQEIINHSLAGKKNYEQIILWMLYNNDECKLLKPLTNNADFYVIANFQDIKIASFEPVKIEEFFALKTFGFSAVSNNAKDKIHTIITEMLNSSSLMIARG